MLTLRNVFPFCLALLPTLLCSCQTSPTGRHQLALVSDGQMSKMGDQAFSEMKAKQPIETNPAINAYVRCVAGAITSVLPKQQWEVVVFKDSQVNAFALPGGKIGVYEGLLPVANTPAELAAVLGHETGHVLAGHGKERVSEQMAEQGGMSILNAIMGNQGDTRHSLLMGALGVGVQYGVTLPHSRRQEAEADRIGLDLMAKAGFNPQESIQLWKNMQKASGGKEPTEFLSDHPSDANRISGLEEGMAKAMQEYQQSGKHPNCIPPK